LAGEERRVANSCDVIIIGAGPAGLATAAALKARGLNAAVLEKSNAVGAVWRRHYDRLHRTLIALAPAYRVWRYRRLTAAIPRALTLSNI
jgi:cation diffusion facilitator CzcD-associated flavoprotein CzcO